MSHFRTITAVIEVADDSDLRYPGFAMESGTRTTTTASCRTCQART
jgi:hypothetical protein